MWMYEALVLTSFGRLWTSKHLMDLLQVIVKSLRVSMPSMHIYIFIKGQSDLFWSKDKDKHTRKQ